MCYSSYSKCYNCPKKFNFSVNLCSYGRQAKPCIDPTKVVNGEIVIRVKVKFSSDDPSSELRGCATPYGYSEEDIIATFMEVQETGAYCAACQAEDDCLILNDMSTPAAPRKRPAPRTDLRKILPARKKRKVREVLGDITSKVN